MDSHIRRAINIFSGGAMILTTMDSDDLPHPVMEDIVKRYYT